MRNYIFALFFVVIACVLFATLFKTANAQSCSGRCRVRISNQTVVADNGYLLRGEHILLFKSANSGQFNPEATDPNYYRKLRDQYHLNTIRLLVYRDIRDNDSQWYSIEEALPYIDRAVEITEELGLYLIIDYHPTPPGVFYLRNHEGDGMAFWQTIAPRYTDKTHLLFEVHNEAFLADRVEDFSPGTNGYKKLQDVIKFEQDVFALIRQADPNVHIVLWTFPRSRGYDLTGIVDQAVGLDYSNASVGYHYYFKDPTLIATMRNKYPIFMTEWEAGENTAGYQDAITSLEEDKISWIMLKMDWAQREGKINVVINWPKDPAAVDATATPIPDQTPTPSPLKPPDINRDGQVNIFDYNIVIENFGQRNCEKNVVGNCKIDVYDFNEVIGNFNQ